jgi:hypothetical protein
MKTTSAALPVQFFLLLHLFSAIFYGSTCYINFIVYIGRQSYKQAWTEVLMVSIWTQTTEIEDGMIHQTHDLNAVPMTADTGSKLLWSRRVPNKIKIFWWLRHINRLNIRANLHHKSIIDSSHCPDEPTLSRIAITSSSPTLPQQRSVTGLD